MVLKIKITNHGVRSSFWRFTKMTDRLVQVHSSKILGHYIFKNSFHRQRTVGPAYEIYSITMWKTSLLKTNQWLRSPIQDWPWGPTWLKYRHLMHLITAAGVYTLFLTFQQIYCLSWSSVQLDILAIKCEHSAHSEPFVFSWLLHFLQSHYVSQLFSHDP